MYTGDKAITMPLLYFFWGGKFILIINIYDIGCKWLKIKLIVLKKFFYKNVYTKYIL